MGSAPLRRMPRPIATFPAYGMAFWRRGEYGWLDGEDRQDHVRCLYQEAKGDHIVSVDLSGPMYEMNGSRMFRKYKVLCRSPLAAFLIGTQCHAIQRWRCNIPIYVSWCFTTLTRASQPSPTPKPFRKGFDPPHNSELGLQGSPRLGATQPHNP